MSDWTKWEPDGRYGYVSEYTGPGVSRRVKVTEVEKGRWIALYSVNGSQERLSDKEWTTRAAAQRYAERERGEYPSAANRRIMGYREIAKE